MMARPIVAPYVAAEWLPGDDGKALKWLHSAGLVHMWGGREVVIWAEVEEAMRALPTTVDGEPPAPVAKTTKKPPAGLARARL